MAVDRRAAPSWRRTIRVRTSVFPREETLQEGIAVLAAPMLVRAAVVLLDALAGRLVLKVQVLLAKLLLHLFFGLLLLLLLLRLDLVLFLLRAAALLGGKRHG